MARPARHDEGEIKVALQMVAEATTLQELRQGQAILLPALTCATMDTTAEIFGLSRARVCVLRRQFGELAKSSREELGERRGGRCCELMSIEEEKTFLAEKIAGDEKPLLLLFRDEDHTPPTVGLALIR